MLKLKLQYFGHLMQRDDSLGKTWRLRKIEGKRRRGWQRMRWLDSVSDSMDMNLSKLQEIVKDRARCWQGWFLLMTVKEGPIPGFLSPWLISGHLLHICSHHIPTYVCVCPNFLLLEVHHSYWMRAHLRDLILT